MRASESYRMDWRLSTWVDKICHVAARQWGKSATWLEIIRPSQLRLISPYTSLAIYLRTFAGRSHTTAEELGSTDKQHCSWTELAVAMASTNMASATSRFMLAAGMPAGGSSTSNRVSFVSSNRLGRRLVVRAEEEPAAPPAPTPAAEKAEGTVATKEPAKAKPPPIGPKRGSKVVALP